MELKTPSRKTAILLLLLAALLWSLGGLLIKWVQMPPLAISGTRSAIAAVVQYIFLRQFCGGFKRIGGFDQIAAAMCYAASVTLFVTSNKLTTSANAILLQYTAPIYIAILGPRLLGERTTRLDWLAVTLSLGGMSLFFLDHLSPAGLTGNVMSIVSGLFYALLAIFMRRQKDANPLESIILGNILTAAIGLPFLTEMPDAKAWTGLLLLGVFQTGASYLVYSIAIRNVKAIEAILILTLEPLLNPLWVAFMLGEVPGPFAILGGLTVIGAITGRGLWAIYAQRRLART